MEPEIQSKTKYYLYIDECGDQNLENFNPSFPVFTLCGVLVSKANMRKLEDEFNALKVEFWGDQNVIIHSRDIRRCKNEFINLLDPDVKTCFYQRVNAILSNNGVYVIVACSILKEPFIRLFSNTEDVYGLSLSYLIERSIFCVDDNCETASIDIIFEKRGKIEDRTLTKFYNGLRVTGTKWVEPERLQSRIGAFTSRAKKDNIIGLQIADLIAYPIARKVLNPEVPNPAFEIIKPNIYSSHGALLGFKVIPH
ncbi:MAG: DUF3800 domain-containing protein [Muribaculaceae bacterium]|nr:DUF3800 domain-containing protein [Muribaculaceae bacterium]